MISRAAVAEGLVAQVGNVEDGGASRRVLALDTRVVFSSSLFQTFLGIWIRMFCFLACPVQGW